MKRCLRLLSVTLIITLAAAAPAGAEEASAPRALVSETVDAVVATLSDPALSPELRAERVKSLIAERLDSQGIARRVLATHWHGATLAERRRFERRFIALVVENYWRKIRDYSDETVDVVGASLLGKRLASVETLIRTSPGDIPVDYKLNLTPSGEWRVYDVVVERVSLVRNYRTSFQQMVQREGLDHVIAELERKLEEIKASGAED
mgnify:CR=1 FL=1